MAQATDAVWLPVLPDMSGFGPGVIKGAGKQADKSGKAVGGRFGTAMLAGVASVAGGAALATRALYGIGETFTDMENTIRVGTGATGEALDGLVESAKNVGRNVPAEFEAVGSTVADINTRMGLTGETLETVAAQYLEAGRILGEEVDIAKTSAAFNAFGIEGESVSEAMDHLFRVSQATGIGMNELAGAVQSNAPAVQALGFSFEETASLVGNLDKAGLNSSRMMMGMSQSLVRLAKDGEQPADAFRRTVDEIDGFLAAGNDAAAIDLAGEVFGTRNATQFIGAIKDGTLAMDDLASVAGMTEDTILGAGQETMTFSERWQMFKNDILTQIEPAATALFDAIGAGMEWIQQNGIPTLQDLGSWLQENKSWLAPIAAGIGAIVAAFTTWIAVTRAWQAITKAAAAVQAALNAVLAANPIGIVVLALVGLVAAFVAAYKNSETFRNIVTAAWEGIKSAASAVWDWMKKAFQWIKDGLSSVGKWFTDRGKDIQGAWEAVRAALAKGWIWIQANVFAPIKRGVNLVKMGFDAARDGIGLAWDAVKNGLKAGWDWIDRNVFQGFRNGLDTLVGWVRSGKDSIVDLWEGVKTAFATPINWVIRNAWNDGLLRAINAVARVIPGVSEISPLPEIRTRAKGGYTPPGWTLVGEEGPELVNFTRPNRVYTARETQAMLAGQVANPVQRGFSASNPPHGGVGGWFSDRWNDVQNAGRWVADGVRDAAGNVVKWARGGLAKAAEIVLNPIRSLIRSSLGSGEGFLGDLLSGAGTMAIDKVLEWLRDEDEGAAPDAGGRSLRGAQPHVNNAAHALADQVGGIRTMQAFNQSMAGAHPAGKAVDFIDSVAKLNRLADVIAGGGHFDNFNYMAWQGRLWSPGRGWRPQGQGFGNDPMHRWHLHAEWYDQGGMLKPGMGVYANATGGPEPVLTSGQWRDISTLAARGSGSSGPLQIEGELTLVNGRAYISGIAQQESDRMMRELVRRVN